jgi:hypothetical protein
MLTRETRPGNAHESFSGISLVDHALVVENAAGKRSRVVFGNYAADALANAQLDHASAFSRLRPQCCRSRREAASRARRENPTLYESYLKSGLAKGAATYFRLSSGSWSSSSVLPSFAGGGSDKPLISNTMHQYAGDDALSEPTPAFG